MNCIEKLNNIKVNLEIYKDYKELKEDFFYILCKEKSLKEIEEFHLFLTEEVIKTNNNEFSEKNQKVFRENICIKNCISQLDSCKSSDRIFYIGNEKNEVYIVGDIHSDTISVKKVIEKTNLFQKIINKDKMLILFLGDYVDRGKEHFKIIEFILMLKYLFPQYICLLKGNHDGGRIENENYKLCVGRNKNTTDRDYFVAYVYNILVERKMSLKLLKAYISFFNSLCLICFINRNDKVYMGVHGGIPRPENKDRHYGYIKSLYDLTNIGIKDVLNKTIVDNILWSDPCEEILNSKEYYSNITKGRFYFYKSHFNEFSNLIGVDKIIRGHQAFDDGIKEFFDRRLICIFSSGRINNHEEFNINNETYYNDIKPKIVRFYNNSMEVLELK